MSNRKPSSPRKANASTSPQKTATKPKPALHPPSAFDQAIDEVRQTPGAFPAVSPRWLAAAAGVAVLAALTCAWLTLCLLYWQGSWQLLYHPKPTITRTPANIGISFEPIKFATTETGTTQLTGWWIPDPQARLSVLLLHGADGNLSDILDTIAALHRQHLSIFAIDYRGYGQSIPANPSEKQLRQDAEWALGWLTITRNVPAQTILVYGSGLGANLAAELTAEPATTHSALAGVILDQPLPDAMAPVFQDSRSRLVPSHWLVRDRYNLTEAATSLQVPSLWLFAEPNRNRPEPDKQSDEAAYRAARAQKSSAWLKRPIPADPHFDETLRRWLDDLP